MITVLLTIVHVFVCVFLILVVLLQTGKGADVAAAFGGSSQTAFGARGASTFLSKMTTISAILFMFTSLTLVLLSSAPGSSVIENAPAQQSAPSSTPAPAPATPPGSSGRPGGGTGAPPATPPSGGSQGSQPATPPPSGGGQSPSGTPPATPGGK